MTKDRIRVRLRGFDIELVEQSAKAIVQTVVTSGAKVSGPVPLPTRINKYTVLRSPLSTRRRANSSKCGHTSV